MRHFVFLAFLILIVSAETSAAKITTTEDLVQAMQKKYSKSWYKTATFVQKTTNFEPDGTSKVEIWYEALSVPGSLRIDFTPTKAGNGILFTNNQIYVFKEGKIETNRLGELIGHTPIQVFVGLFLGLTLALILY